MQICKSFCLIAVFLLLVSGTTHLNRYNKLQEIKWDPDAGVVFSYTMDAVCSTSSNAEAADKITDQDPETAWQSDAPLPQGFISRPGQNVLLGCMPRFHSGTNGNPVLHTTDGNLQSAALIRSSNGERILDFPFDRLTPLLALAVKCSTPGTLYLEAILPDGTTKTLGTYQKDENFTLKRFDMSLPAVSSIRIRSEDDFELFEVAMLDEPPKESVQFDFGKLVPVGVVQSRYWPGAGTANSIGLYLSRDAGKWNKVKELSPGALHEVVVSFAEQEARYLKIEYVLEPKDWNKVFLWEVKAFDKYGPYGPRPPVNPGAVSLKELLGVNGYWSWGTDRYSDQLGQNEGPLLYNSLASHARNYHDMTWDVPAPGDPIHYGKMASQGTPAKDWVNWDREYKSWRKAGFDIQASLQFFRFQPEQWKSPEQDAYAYARAFTRHFGPKNGSGLVCSIEAGNEPWAYPADIYRQILSGMARGAHDGDPGVEVFPCALQAADPSAETAGMFKNYIGARIDVETAPLLDGINIHAYSYVTAENGVRRAVHPEHPQSTFWEINNAVRWRDHNMPGKKIYLSEWGWESEGGGEACTHNECVSPQAAASYAIRGALIAARLGMERATWFFYANEQKPSSLYTRSGLTTSGQQSFRKKSAYFALQALVELAGDLYFIDVINEDERAWIYLLGDRNGQPTHLIGWRPVSGDDLSSQSFSFKTGFSFGKAWLLNGRSTGPEEVGGPETQNGICRLSLSSVPLIIAIN